MSRRRGHAGRASRRTAPSQRARRTSARNGALEIWKFGGASLATAENIRKAVALIAAHPGPLVVVASALGGVTDRLLAGAAQALAGDGKAVARTAADFLKRHRDIIRRVVPHGDARRALLAALDAAAREYRDLAVAIGVLGHIEPRASDTLVSRGERLSASILAATLTAARAAVYVDAASIVRTDGHHGGAAPDLAHTSRLAKKAIGAHLSAGRTPVVPGFIGLGPDGTITTLGRGGSDLSATMLARALGATKVVLWKDVPGILTADPRLVTDARLIPELHHREAAEVAHYGAKVLHPRALIPIAGTRIVLNVRSFIDTERPGTEVSARRSDLAHPVKAIATVRDQAVVTVSGKGMAGVHGIAARTFVAVDAERLSVSTIFQASSENSIGFTLPEAEADRAVRAISRAFREELSTGLIDNVTARPGMAVIAVVGDGMVGTPGVAARVFSALSNAGVNVVAIAQGSSERNISFVVREAEVQEAVRRVHTAFQLSKIGGGRPHAKPYTDVVFLGFGRVGRALADQIAAATDGAPVRVVGVVDRSGYVFEPRGLANRRLLELARAKEGGALVASLGGTRASAADALATIGSHAVSHPVIVDVTGHDHGALLVTALSQGFNLALANKKPVAGSLESYRALLDTARQSGRTIRYEATVGAGLPLIDT